MATSFPTSIDVLTNPTGASALTSPDHAGQHTDANDALEAIEAQIGTTAAPVLARLASPTFTGTPSAPTASLATNTTQIATTAFVIANSSSGDVVGPASATDNAITRYDLTTGKLVQTSLAIISDAGAISTPNNTGSMIPFYYADVASFPAAANSHGAVAHSHATGKMYYAHSGSWIELATTSATDLTSGTLDNLRLPAVATTITSVGTLGSLAVTAGVTAATFTGNADTATVSTGANGVGYMGLPQNSATTGAYGVLAADAGKHIYSTATRTITIPANATIAMPIGATIVFVAATGATVTISITSDTMYLAGTGTTGSRTLAAFGVATAIKITSTSWIISGNGLT